MPPLVNDNHGSFGLLFGLSGCPGRHHLVYPGLLDVCRQSTAKQSFVLFGIVEKQDVGIAAILVSVGVAHLEI